jgi:hypothetical protein
VCRLPKGWVAAAALAVCVSAASAQAVHTEADQARTRSKEFTPPPVQTVSEAQRAQAQQLATQASARGRDALELPGGGKAPLGRFPSAPKDAPPGELSEDGGSASKPALQGRLIVALSSSMPLPMVHEYMRQLAGIPEAIVVLRGFVGGAQTVAPTGRWIEEARRVDPTCLRCEHYNVEVVVDPLVYRALKLEQVPAVAYAAGISDLSHCDGKQLPVKSVAYGATSIEAAVRALVADGAEVPSGVLERVRKRGWEYKTPKHSGSP